MRIKCSSIETKIADCDSNAQAIKDEIKKAFDEKVDLLVFPELTLTGCSCGDMFRNQQLLTETEKRLYDVVKFTKDYDLVTILGAPILRGNDLYNTVFVVYKGEIKGALPKTSTSNDRFKNDARYFTSYVNLSGFTLYGGLNATFSKKYNIGDNIAFGLTEDLEDVSGVPMIIEPASAIDTLNHMNTRENKIKVVSDIYKKIIVYCSGRTGESTTDHIYSDTKVIAMNGKLLKEDIETTGVIADIDLDFINNKFDEQSYATRIDYEDFKTNFMTGLSRLPYLDGLDLDDTCKKIIELQGYGLIQKMKAMNRKKIVLGVSGGLDSTSTLLSCAYIFKKYGLDPKDIIGVQMPCFGTSERTYNNSIALMKALGIDMRVIDLKEVVQMHLDHIGQPRGVYDLRYRYGGTYDFESYEPSTCVISNSVMPFSD